MSKKILLVFSNPVDGGDHDFNEWCTNFHLDGILAIDGFVLGNGSNCWLNS